MGDGNEKRSASEVNSLSTISTSSSKKAMSSFSLEISKYPRDLLERFNLYDPSGANLEEEKEADEEEEEGSEGMELELGLSLGGRFGVEKSSYSIEAYSFFKRKKITRSSSIAGSIPLPRDENGFSFGGEGMLAATGAEKVTAAVGGAQYRPTALLRTSSLPVETEEEWRKRKEMQCLRRKDAKRRRSQKQQRGGGSGTSELKRSGGKTRSSANTQSLQDRINQEAAGPSATRTNENPNRTSRAKVDDQSKRGRENTSISVGEMPCVSTKGDGPNGRRVDGILYRYCRGEEVRIMCICHGIFHTPAEFVTHAGGTDIDNPLRHIVMNPSGPSF